VSIDVLKGNIFVGDKEFNFVPFTEFIMEIIDSGGLLEYTKKVIKCTK